MKTADLDRLWKRTTQGEWHASHPDSVFSGSRLIAGSMPSYGAMEEPHRNAEWIAAAHNEWPQLRARLAELERTLGLIAGPAPFPLGGVEATKWRQQLAEEALRS